MSKLLEEVYSQGRKAAEADDFYTEGQSVSRSPNPYNSNIGEDKKNYTEWERGYSNRRQEIRIESMFG